MAGLGCLDFLQRISTNDVSSVVRGLSVQTVLTNEKGKIIDVITVLNEDERRLILLGQSGGTSILKSWIEKYIIMEDIRCTDITSNYVQVLLYGTEIISRGRLLERLPVGSLIVEETWSGCRMYRMAVEVERKEFAEKALLQLGFLPSSWERYDEFRIQYGIPVSPNELSVSYNPLEAGLKDLISWTKGCYIGQEVIARLDTYKKVQKKLMRLTMEELPQSLPVALATTGAECGMMTSSRVTSDTQKCIGLGYVRTDVIFAGRDLSFLNDGKRISVVIER